jgi:hypothetical protein
MPAPQFRNTHYEPKLGDVVTVLLPDERTRATIEKLVSDTACIVRLNHFVTATKSHNYRKGDLVPCRYGVQDMGLPGWTAVSAKELEEATPPPDEPADEEGTPDVMPEPSIVAVPPPGMTYEDL